MKNKVAAVAGVMVMLATTALPSFAAQGAEPSVSIKTTRNNSSYRNFTKRHTTIRNGKRRTYECRYTEVNGKVYTNKCYWVN